MNRFFLLSLFLFSPLVLADDNVEEPKVIYKARTEIDFEGVEIAGELVRPQGQLVMERHSAQFNPLIKLRADFDKEMDASVEEIK